MIRPFALLGFSAYAALALCMALGPENAWVLALLCLGLACGAAFVRVGAGFVCQRKGLLDQKELSEEPPMALSVFRGLFWAAAALAMAGLLCGMCALKWQQTEPLQELEGRRLTVRAQVLDYPEERYHRYYYRLRVEALGEEDTLEPTEPFILRLSTTMPLRCQPCDWVECLVTFNAFDSSGGLYSTRNSRLADGFQAGGYLSQYTGVPVEENPALPFGEMLARLRNQVGRERDRLLPRREAGFLRAMVLGDGSGISEADMTNFRQLGVSHILVVSGMHITVLAGFLQLLLKRLPVRKAVGNALTALVILLFLALSGFQPSASRGAAMFVVLLLADSAGRRSDGLNSLGLAVLAVCLFNPFAGGDLGFALSVTATLGIVLLYQPLARVFLGKPGKGLAFKLWKPAAVSLAATAAALLGTFPVQMAVFGGFPLLLPVANFLMAVPGTAVLYLGFCGSFLTLLPATAPLAAPFVWAAGWASRLLLRMAQTLSQWKGTFLSLSSGPLLAVTAGLLLLLIAAVLVGKDRTLRAVIAGAMAALVLSGGVFQGWLDRDQAVFVLPASGTDSCVVLVRNHQAAVLSLGGYRTSAVNEILQRHNVTQVETLCLPVSTPESREAAVQVLEEYGAKALVLPQDGYVGRDLELALGDTEPVCLPAGESFSPLPGVTAQILPRWEGLRLTVNGVETLVEWEPAASQSCGLLLTNQGETRVNSALSVWQTDGIIEETSLDGAFAGPVLPVEEGCLAVAISPAGELSAGWDS